MEANACDYEKYGALYAEKEAMDEQLLELMEKWEQLAEADSAASKMKKIIKAHSSTLSKGIEICVKQKLRNGSISFTHAIPRNPQNKEYIRHTLPFMLSGRWL